MKKTKKYLSVVITNKKSAIEFVSKKNAIVFGIESDKDISDPKEFEHFIDIIQREVISFPRI